MLVGTLGFVGGRWSTPTKVVESVKHTETVKDTTIVQQKVDIAELRAEFLKFAQQIQKDVSKKRVVTINADGSKSIVEETTDKSKTDTTSSSDKTEQVVTHTEETVKLWKETVRVEEKYKLVENLKAPDTWVLGLQLGISFPHIIDGAVPSYLPWLPKQTVLGLSVQKRLIGPFYGGLWLNSRLDGGLQLSAGF
jgi:sugar diacid utilization regulator